MTKAMFVIVAFMVIGVVSAAHSVADEAPISGTVKTIVTRIKDPQVRAVDRAWEDGVRRSDEGATRLGYAAYISSIATDLTCISRGKRVPRVERVHSRTRVEPAPSMAASTAPVGRRNVRRNRSLPVAVMPGRFVRQHGRRRRP